MNKLVKRNLVRDLPSKLFENVDTCVACQKGKQHKASCKFDGKDDEGFFIGYFLNSKAFRVFNNKTRIVKENLHIRFSENTPNIAGTRPNWLFDIDALTKLINYKPVVAGNQSNGNAGIKTCDDAEGDEDPRQESKCKDQKKEDNVNTTNNVNAASTNEVNDVGANTNNELPFDPKVLALEDISTFNFLSDHKDADEEADMNNMDTTIQVSQVKNASTPMKNQKPLLKDEDGKEVDVYMYRSMIGSLMYLTSLRPDIMFTVCTCARYQVNPKVSHLHAVKRIFRYLKGQPKFSIWYPKDFPFDLVAYTDSDYAGASLDRKSTTGDCQFLGHRLISWQCKKQTVVANSTTEVEYMVASSCCGQVLWI
uniref:Uncharacterized mitochondrial protein AtMg00810-like n=1 Tax=Tanacetum cinerariifolium TaxID=118510 RepID=A0A699JIN6_TANCI|nr:uncharacterized mitochondrial protein AtMg00810-like [Tanacetum cinerariifolium]